MPYTTHVRFDELFDESMDYLPAVEGGERLSSSGPEGGSEGLPAGQDQPGRRRFPTGGGVYLLTDAEDRFIQLAAAADLKRALTNRLAESSTSDEAAGQRPPQSAPSMTGAEEAGATPMAGQSAGLPPAPQLRRRRADLREIVRRIRWRPAHSMFEITLEYHRIARLLMPDGYLKQVGFGPCWFVHVDPAAPIPRFQSGKLLRSPPGVDLGPFATQADAGRFIEILEDAFDLCRYYHILQQAPGGQACAYFDMGKCPAPCNGSISMDAYRGMIGRALAFVCGDRQEAYRGWEAAMRAAAGQRAFERAGAIKQLIERARRIEHEAYRFVRPIEGFRYLVVQRGDGSRKVKPFFVRAGDLASGPAVRLKELAEAVPGWIEQTRAALPAETDTNLRSERIWLVSHFLFKREPPGLFIHADSLGGPEDVAERIRAHFASRKKEELRDLGGEQGGEAAEGEQGRG